MPNDLSAFHPCNVVDTCAVWNLLSSWRLYRAAIQNRAFFICTDFVVYECLHKPRKKPPTYADQELQRRLQKANAEKGIDFQTLDTVDLQSVQILEKRKHLGKGELSTIAYALKISQAALTDDRPAKKLAVQVMQSNHVQTTPHLVGWLFFKGYLSYSDKSSLLLEHQEMNRPLGSQYEQTYEEACRCRLLAGQNGTLPKRAES